MSPKVTPSSILRQSLDTPRSRGRRHHNGVLPPSRTPLPDEAPASSQTVPESDDESVTEPESDDAMFPLIRPLPHPVQPRLSQRRPRGASQRKAAQEDDSVTEPAEGDIDPPDQAGSKPSNLEPVPSMPGISSSGLRLSASMRRDILSQERRDDEEDSHTEPESDDEPEGQKTLRSHRNASKKSQKSPKARSQKKSGPVLPSRAPSRRPPPTSIAPSAGAALGSAVNETSEQTQSSAVSGESPDMESSYGSWDAQSFPNVALNTQMLERLPSAAAGFLGMFKDSK